MKEEDLLEAVGDVDGKYVENADKAKKVKRKMPPYRWIGAVAAAALLILIGVSIAKMVNGGKGPEDGGESAFASSDSKETTQESSATKQGQNGQEEPGGKDNQDGIRIAYANKESIKTDYEATDVKYVPSLVPYHANADLSNVKDVERFWLQEDEKAKLAANNFVVTEGQNAEFFDIYEFNRYAMYPNFITSDSMMHTYHLYFAMLQKRTERQSLYGAVERMTDMMLKDAEGQYDALKGSEWEEAAKLNVAFFGIASKLLGKNELIPDYASGIVNEELGKIMNASGIEVSQIMNEYEDYSQYKPRGYYEGDELLEKYFRVMMLYGHLNFIQKSETMNRCALLMTLAMRQNEACRKEWGDVYKVTAFFVGESDDLGYFEYLPAIDDAYGKNVTVKDLIGNSAGFQKYVEGISLLRAPQVNSVVFEDDGGETDKRQESKGFRFMGQRFTMDAAVFTQLTYSQIKPDGNGNARMLPDGLDVPAAFGSDLALELLVEKGNDRYPNYLETMKKIRDKIRTVKDYWSSSLYGGWLYTLMPLLEQRGDGFPSFMTSREWQKRSLEGYLGSWTELKHDTILYAKQSMAEMGGGDDVVYDDRGYVEPQPELYARLYALTKTTMEGLEELGYLGENERDGLAKLGELSMSLRDISVKELQNEKLTDEEFELIRSYGGSLEHLWLDTIRDEINGRYVDSAEFPMALVADVATDPNGACLEEAIGGAARIYVIFPLDGELHLGIGGVFNYYQFVQPISDRLTDKEWRIKLGIQLDDNDEYRPDRSITGPEWTDSYRYKWNYEY